MEVGDRIGSYRVTAALGEGGMGSVWEAFDERLQRRVALKLLKLSAFSESTRAEARGRFLREARALAALSHPKVVTVFEVGEAEGEPFLAMERVEGEPLARWIGDAAVPLSRKLRWLRDLASALAAVHHAGLVHRDVKPANVMVTASGDIKLVDFGIARARRDEAGGEAATVAAGLGTLTRGDVAIGTPLYMAPEQLRGDPVGPAADQFAWGVTAYQLLAGRPPWTGDDSLHILSAILERDPAPLASDAIPEHVARTVGRALAKREADRFAAMEDVVAALESPAVADTQLAPAAVSRASAVADTAARPPSRPAAAVLPARRHGPVLVVAVGAVLVAVVAGLVLGRGRGRGGDATSGASVGAGDAERRAAPLPIRDLPIPASHVEAARDAYRAGLGAMAADGSISALPLFERAAELDPTMAAARIRLLVIGSWNAGVDVGPRFAEAKAHEARLDERDRGILDALEPFYRLDPPDRGQARDRLRRLVEQRPGDAEIGLVLTAGTAVDTDPEYLTGFERVLAIDPTLPDALGFRIQHCAYVGDAACVAAAEADCRTRSPASFVCLHNRSEQAEDRGECELAEELGRSLIKNGTAKEYGYRAVLAGMGMTRPRRALESLIEAGRDEGAIVPGKAAVSLSSVAALFGDFDAAATHLAAAEAAVGSTRSQAILGSFARQRARLAQETGRSADAAREARAFLDVRDALVPDPHADDFAIGKDVVPRLLHVLGEVEPDPEDLARRRDRWITDWGRRLKDSKRSWIWLHGWAGSVHDEVTARQAIEARPAHEPIPTFRPRGMTELDEGRMYMLLGRWTEAAERLRRATRICRAIAFPLEHVHAHELLGRVLEKTGDLPGACAAYQTVLERWGEARPRSITADRARARVTALGCESARGPR